MMQNRRLFVFFGMVIFFVGAAAFLAGRLFRLGIGPGSESGALGNGKVFISMNDITPAPELPVTTPEITGFFVERKDNTVTVRTVSFDAGVGGIAQNALPDAESGPRVEVIVTVETAVYRETTEFGRPVPGEDYSIQQTVEESKLDDMNSQTMITVWGRKNGERIIAEVLVYMNPWMIKKP
jgi:hypothetical protein